MNNSNNIVIILLNNNIVYISIILLNNINDFIKHMNKTKCYNISMYKKRLYLTIRKSYQNNELTNIS